MILARERRHYRFAIMALIASVSSATPAYADVLEVTPEGARWVAGGPPQVQEQVLPAAPLEDVSGILISEAIVANPQLHAAGIPAQYAAKIGELARAYGLSPALLEAVVWQESRWRETAVSPAGARGLAQLMPGTARYLGVDPDDPMQNLEGGARYLREQLDRFDGDLEKALAAYNAGPGRVIRAGGIPNIRETQNYVASIMGRLANHSRPNVQHLSAGHR